MNAPMDFLLKQANGFADLTVREGYDKAPPEDIVLPAYITYDVQGGTSGKDTGAPATQTFFAFTTNDLVAQVQDPPIQYKVQLGGEFLLCVYAFSLRFDAQGYGGTLVETREVQAALALAVFSMYFGSDRVLTERGRRCTWFGEGLLVGSDGANGAGASLPSRAEALAVDYVYMPNPRVLGSTQQILANHFVSKATWTTDNDFDVQLQLKAWLGRKK